MNGTPLVLQRWSISPRWVHSFVQLVILGLACSCVTGEANARYAANVAAINSGFTAAAAKLDSDDQDAAAALNELSKQIVNVDETSHVVPTDPVSEHDDLENLRVSCNQISGADALDDLAQCLTLYHHRLWNELAKRYWAADFGWVIKQLADANSDDRVESLFVYSHNLRLTTYVEAKQRELDKTYQRSLADLRALKVRQLEEARKVRDAEVAQAEMRIAMSIAAFAKGFAAARTNTSNDANEGPARGCRSDFDCRLGFKCLKQNYASVGACTQSVDSYGMPTYDLPAMDSLFTKLPAAADCRFDADCPVGFRCQASSGACWK
jgi:hypothetical protein